jgi:hypothetical protein
VAVVQRNPRMVRTKACDLAGQCGVIGTAILSHATRTFTRVGYHAHAPQRRVIEGGGGHQHARGLLWVEQWVGWVAVDIDDGARNACVDHGGTHFAHEAVEPVDPPIGILARQPGRRTARLDGWGNIRASVCDADNERRVAAL